jgi:hypothetical protein
MAVVMYTATREGAMAQVLDLDLLDHVPLHRILVASRQNNRLIRVP